MFTQQPIKLCTRRSCCPSVTYDSINDQYRIEDDYGGVTKCSELMISSTYEDMKYLSDDAKIVIPGDQADNKVFAMLSKAELRMLVEKLNAK